MINRKASMEKTIKRAQPDNSDAHESLIFSFSWIDFNSYNNRAQNFLSLQASAAGPTRHWQRRSVTSHSNHEVLSRSLSLCLRIERDDEFV